ncbi:MAG: hypothetical protein SPK97_02105 [Bacteroidales bacterium]|jgi:hypothetical protein|nr:hypothetical protein [Bacteroidales bacterium]
MKTLKPLLIFCAVLLSFSACARYVNWEMWAYSHKDDKYCPDSLKMVGIWKANDGATIELRYDGTCTLRNVQRIIENSHYSGGDEDTAVTWNYDGYWYIEPELYSDSKDTLGYKLHLDSRPPSLRKEEKINWNKGGYDVLLYIHNKKESYSRKVTPISLYNFIGDPDLFRTYEFFKQK